MTRSLGELHLGADSYGFPLSRPRRLHFLALLREELSRRENTSGPGSLAVLDIGCGKGIDRDVSVLRSLAGMADELWGVEPDPAIEIEQPPFHRVVRASLELADLPAGYFDVAFAYLVAEHVRRPPQFLEAVFRTLKPGGVLILFTPNERHFFGRVTKLMVRLGLTEWVLRRVRPPDTVSDYHSPVYYRMNSVKRIRLLGEEAGFNRVSTHLVEDPQDTLPYFPKGTRWIWAWLMWKRRVLKSPGCLLHIYARLSRDGEAME